MSASVVPPGAEVLWRPHAGSQTLALRCGAYELLYGGEAGGGKSDYLLAGALRWVKAKGFRGIIFRRVTGELEDLIERTHEIYPQFGGQWSGQKGRWTFFDQETGERISRIYLKHMEKERDALTHKGQAYNYCGFDELTTFTKPQYTYLSSRMRSAQGIPIRLRATTNPEPNWVRDRFGAWVDKRPQYDGLHFESGEVAWVVTDPEGYDHLFKAPPPQWVLQKYKSKGALTRTFIAGPRKENVALMEKDPDYELRFQILDPIQRARVEFGDWAAEYRPGLLFQRQWFPLVQAVPNYALRIRFWDLAATEEKIDGRKNRVVNDPDWSVGTLLTWPGPGLPWYVEDVQRFRAKPGEVYARMQQTAQLDALRGPHYSVGWELRAGSEGEAEGLMQRLAPYTPFCIRPSGNKIVRAGPVSAQAMAHNIMVLMGLWNSEWFDELEAFPTGLHDDRIDSLSGAFLAMISLPAEFVQAFFGESGATRFDGIV